MCSFVFVFLRRSKLVDASKTERTDVCAVGTSEGGKGWLRECEVESGLSNGLSEKKETRQVRKRRGRWFGATDPGLSFCLIRLSV
jgi:hypothetical protein